MSYMSPLTIGRPACPLSFSLFLYSKFYVVFPSTHGPLNSKPTKASTKGPCVLSKTDENIGLHGSQESSYTYVCDMIDSVCIERLYPGRSPGSPTGLAHAGAWVCSSHLRD